MAEFDLAQFLSEALMGGDPLQFEDMDAAGNWAQEIGGNLDFGGLNESDFSSFLTSLGIGGDGFDFSGGGMWYDTETGQTVTTKEAMALDPSFDPLGETGGVDQPDPLGETGGVSLSNDPLGETFPAGSSPSGGGISAAALRALAQLLGAAGGAGAGAGGASSGGGFNLTNLDLTSPQAQQIPGPAIPPVPQAVPMPPAAPPMAFTPQAPSLEERIKAATTANTVIPTPSATMPTGFQTLFPETRRRMTEGY